MFFLHHFGAVEMSHDNCYLILNADESSDYHYIEEFIYSEIEKYALYDGWYLRKIKEFNKPSLFNLNKYFNHDKNHYCGSLCNFNQNKIIGLIGYQLTDGNLFGTSIEKYLVVKVNGIELNGNVIDIMESQVRHIYDRLLQTRQVQIKRWILEGVEPGLAANAGGDYQDRIMNSFKWNEQHTVENLIIRYPQELIHDETIYYLAVKNIFFSMVLAVFAVLMFNRLFFANNKNL